MKSSSIMRRSSGFFGCCSWPLLAAVLVLASCCLAVPKVSHTATQHNLKTMEQLAKDQELLKLKKIWSRENIRAEPPVTSNEPPVTPTEPPVTTTEPPVMTTEPPVTTTEPSVTATEPPVTTNEPPATTTEPPVTPTEPPVTPTEPPVMTTEPPVTTTEPSVTTTEPPVTTTEPPITTTKPPVTTTKPPVTTTKLPVMTTEPPITTTEPPVTTTEPPAATTTTTTEAPSNGLHLYEQTQKQLNDIKATLEKFLEWIKPDEKKDETSHPAVWWRLKDKGKEDKAEKETSIAENIDICLNSSVSICNDLETNLKEINDLLSRLNSDVERWWHQDLLELTKENEELSDIYNRTQEGCEGEELKDVLDAAVFKIVIEDMDKEVKKSIDNVKNEITNITEQIKGSISLVATIGTLSGLMVLALLVVMAYGLSKNCKKPSSAPYNKLEGENIPIEAFVSYGPESHQPSRMEHYAHTPVPPPPSRPDTYSAPYRSEPPYRGPTITREGQKLPRTHF